MLKKLFAMILLLIPMWLVAQDMPFSVKAKTRYSSSGMIGYTTIDSTKYFQLRFIQEFKVWKIGIGLDMDFLVDNDRHLRPDNWDHIKDVLGKIYYMKYAQKGDPFYVQVGGFPGLTLGNGLIMQNYSNMQLYPEFKSTGLMIGANPEITTHPSFEIFTSNIEKNQILALAARCRPIPDSTIKILDEIVVGATIVTDRNQYGNLRYLAADSLAYTIDHLKRKPATAFGFAYTLPVLRKFHATFGQYAEYAHIMDYGDGFILPGIYGDFGFLKLNLEYRIYGDKFTPAFFDKKYEEQRATVIGDTTITFFTKEEILKTYKASQGWYGSVQILLYQRFKAMFAWQNTFGKELKTGKSLWMDIWVDSQYKRLENFAISYSKTGTETMAIRRLNEPSAEISGSTTIRTYKKKVFLIAKYSEKYNDRNGDGKVKWLNETKRSWGVGVKFIF